MDLSGVAGIYYKFGSPPVSPFDGTFVPGYNFASGLQVPGEGEYAAHIWLRDLAGNADHRQRVTLPAAAHFDATAPVTRSPSMGSRGRTTGTSAP
ncbi:MAG: hypothetical protein HZY76_03085 [Anaerolineae bacterium]|nr:MAG: hypothetical protein HZY76_03085 [Anaerolineae bacterium]